MNLFFGNCQGVNLLPGLIRKYYFNGNAFDTSGNGVNGTVDGAVLTNNRKSQSNSSYSFNGSSQIYCSNTGIDLLSAISFSCWIKPTALGDNDAIMFSRGTSNYVLGLSVMANGNVRFDVSNGSTTIFAISQNQPLYVNNWFHIVCTFSANGNAKIYVNGNLVATSASVMSGPVRTETLIRFGYDSYSSSRYFNGIIDDIRFYDRALSLNEIAALFTE